MATPLGVNRSVAAVAAGPLRDGARLPMEVPVRLVGESRTEAISGQCLNLDEHTLQGRNEGE